MSTYMKPMDVSIDADRVSVHHWPDNVADLLVAVAVREDDRDTPELASVYFYRGPFMARFVVPDEWPRQVYLTTWLDGKPMFRTELVRVMPGETVSLAVPIAGVVA